MSTFLFPDVNVWLALAHDVHPHHDAAARWGRTLGPEVQLYFCRFTQLGLLRLLTNSAVMGDAVVSQRRAWLIYDNFVAEDKTMLIEEPRGLETRLRALAKANYPSTKLWADAYFSSFASLSGFQLVTFDSALSRRTKDSILLRG